MIEELKSVMAEFRSANSNALKPLRTAKASSSELKEPQTTHDLLKASLLYRAFQAEREEILRHKWFESEKAGHDIGFDLAHVDWQLKHRPRWRREWQEKHASFDFEI
jgi:hypothetical protein